MTFSTNRIHPINPQKQAYFNLQQTRARLIHTQFIFKWCTIRHRREFHLMNVWVVIMQNRNIPILIMILLYFFVIIVNEA